MTGLILVDFYCIGNDLKVAPIYDRVSFSSNYIAMKQYFRYKSYNCFMIGLKTVQNFGNVIFMTVLDLSTQEET